MTPQQKHAIIVMLDSIQSQVDVVRSLLGEPWGADSPGGHKTTATTSTVVPDYLTDTEEDELAKAMTISPEEKTALLASWSKLGQTAEGKTDVDVSHNL